MKAFANRRKRSGLKVLAMAAGSAGLPLLVAAPLQATAFSWFTATSGNFNSASRWTPSGGPPGSADTAAFNVSGTYTTTFTNSPTNAHMSVGGISNVTFVTNGSARTYTVPGTTSVASTLTLGTSPAALLLTTGNLLVANSTTGLNSTTLNVNAGNDVSSSDFYLVPDSGGTATTTISGSGSTFNSGDAIIGMLPDAPTDQSGTSTLTFQDNASGAFGALKAHVSLFATTENGGGVTAVNVLTGADITVSSQLDVGAASHIGTVDLNITGLGSTGVVSGAGLFNLGGTNLGPSRVNLNSGGSLTIGTGDTTIKATGVLNISGGSTFTTGGDVDVNTDGGSETFAGINLTGSGSTFTQNGGSKRVRIGHPSDGGATITVGSGSVFTTNSIQEMRIHRTGEIIVNAGGTFNTSGSVTIDDLSGTGTKGRITLTGPGANFVQTGLGLSGQVKVQQPGGRISVNSGATFTTGTGETILTTGGILDINGGTYNSNDDIWVQSGGTLLRSSTGSLVWRSGRTMDVLSGGLVNITGFYATPTNAVIDVRNAGSQLNQLSSSVLRVGNGAQVTIRDGADSSLVNLDLATGGGDGTFTVDGSGSSLTVGFLTDMGQNGGVGNLVFQAGATGALNGGILMTNSGNSASESHVTVQSNADVTTSGNVIIGQGTNASQNSSVTVTGAGSTFTHLGAAALTIGSASTNTATLNVNAAAQYALGSGLTTVNTSGEIYVTGGSTLLLDDCVNNGYIKNDASTVTFNGDYSGSGIYDSDPATNSFRNVTIDPGGLMQGVSGDVFTINGSLVNNGTFTGAATVNISGTMTNNGVLNQTGGSIQVAAFGGTGSTTFAAGSSVTVDHLRQNALTANGTIAVRANGGNTGTSRVNTLNINSSGKLDVNNNKLIVQFGTNPSPLATVRNYIRNGRGGTGFGNANWNGTAGIKSAAAAPGGIGDGTNPGDGISFAVGYVENSFLPQLGLPSYTNFGGQTADSGSMLIRFTKGADANLDGKVNSDDVTIVGALYNNPSSGHWFLGDFDYDGICDSDDVTVLGALYDATAPALSPTQLSAQYGSEFAAAFELGRSLGTSVPEPGGMLGVGVAGVVLSRRRGRQI